MGDRTEEHSQRRATEAALIQAEMRAEARLTMPGLLIFAATCTAAWAGFRDTAAPPWAAHLWLAAALLSTAVIASLILRYRQLAATNPEALRRWQWLGPTLRQMQMLIVALAPWCLMRGAEPMVQVLGLSLMIWFLAISLLASSAASRVPAAGILGVSGSAALFALATGVPLAPYWAAFLVAAGLSMLLLRGRIRHSVVEAVMARLNTEAAAADARQALAVAAAERDARARFIASASHDLQQPIAAARMWATIGMEAPPGPARARAAASTERAFAAATGLVDSMLDHLRLEAGAVRARLEPVAVAPILTAVAKTHAPAAAPAGIRIRIASGRWVALADPPLLARAVGNLVHNAIRHSGGRRLLLGARRTGDSVAIWVIDDGHGIDRADQDRLFEDYSQGSRAAAGGFGPGLCRKRWRKPPNERAGLPQHPARERSPDDGRSTRGAALRPFSRGAHPACA